MFADEGPIQYARAVKHLRQMNNGTRQARWYLLCRCLGDLGLAVLGANPDHHLPRASLTQIFATLQSESLSLAELCRFSLEVSHVEGKPGRLSVRLSGESEDAATVVHPISEPCLASLQAQTRPLQQQVLQWAHAMNELLAPLLEPAEAAVEAKLSAPAETQLRQARIAHDELTAQLKAAEEKARTAERERDETKAKLHSERGKQVVAERRAETATAQRLAAEAARKTEVEAARRAAAAAEQRAGALQARLDTVLADLDDERHLRLEAERRLEPPPAAIAAHVSAPGAADGTGEATAHAPAPWAEPSLPVLSIKEPIARRGQVFSVRVTWDGFAAETAYAARLEPDGWDTLPFSRCIFRQQDATHPLELRGCTLPAELRAEITAATLVVSTEADPRTPLAAGRISLL